MTTFKKSKSANWVAADNDFGDMDCLETENVLSTRKRGRAENNNTVKNTKQINGLKTRSLSETGVSPTQIPLVDLPDDQTYLWINKHRPDKIEDLAVNSKKVEEVRWWMENKRSGILLLTGPSGTGKTATVASIANKLRIEVKEWVNPIEQVDYGNRAGLIEDQAFIPHDTVLYSSKGKQFKDWLRGARYVPLCGSSTTSQLILVEDLPSQAYHKIEEFHSVLESFAGVKSGVPIVFIISETASAKKSGSVKQIFPPEFIQKLGITMINFNPVTTTNIVKVLTRIATLEAKEGIRKFKVPDKNTLEQLCDSVGGDIRGAINALQFSCLNNTQDLCKAFQGVNRITSKVAKRGSKKETSGGSELSKIGGKDQSLVMFHALGKILYSKRQDQLETFALPTHLQVHKRRTLNNCPEEVVEKTTLSPDPFTCFLHHNYPDFYTKIEDVRRLSDYLSFSDLLLQEWGTTGKMSTSEYGGSVAARAVMFCNSAMTPNLGMKKITKPEFYSANRTQRNRLYSVQNMFHTQATKELCTSTIPLLARLRSTDFSLTQMATITELGNFPGLRSVPTRFSKPIDQNDVFDEDDEDLVKATTDKPEEEELKLPVIEEEDFNIEEFDD